jgi:hypothetical protein
MEAADTAEVAEVAKNELEVALANNLEAHCFPSTIELFL